MTDERKPRAGTLSDARDRRRRSNPPGVPVEIDHELTPPPQEIPRPDQLPGFDTIAPPIRAQLQELHSGQAQLVTAIGKVWDLRDGAWRDRLERDIAAIAKSATRHETILDVLQPQLDRWRAVTDELSQQLPKLVGMVENLTLYVRSIDDRMRTLERELGMLGERASGHADDLSAALEREDELVKRVAKLEQAERDRETAAATLAKVERGKAKVAGGVTGGVVGVIAGIVYAIVEALR